MGIKLKEGRNFSKDLASDSLAVIINETAARAFGWETGALGHTITGKSDNEGTEITYHIIGVAKDFHFTSLHDPITPVMLVLGKDRGTMIAKIKTADVAGLIATMKSKWTAEEPFSYSFMDERFSNTYRAEQKVGNILNIFAGITIFVACLGLFGLATFTAQQRTKEIGVRKVLGASVAGIVTLLSKDFIKLVLVAMILASPVAWYLASVWLEDFAYRINISWWMFIAAGAGSIILAIVTVSFQAIKAAMMNPVKSLRSE
jgi:putative ABC transport system permease protein